MESYENLTCNSRSLRSSLRPVFIEFRCQLRFVSVSIFIHCNVYTSFYFHFFPSFSWCDMFVYSTVTSHTVYPKTPRVAPLPWSGGSVPSFFHPLVLGGFRVWLWCILFFSYCNMILYEERSSMKKARWLGSPTRPYINALFCWFSREGKVYFFVQSLFLLGS